MKLDKNAFENLPDDARFDLLERPEDWPDDPEIQAQLAEMLELHLSFCDNGVPSITSPKPVLRLKPFAWSLAACAAAVLPLVFVIHHVQGKRSVQELHATAQIRIQERRWADFFKQSAHLIERFERTPNPCSDDREDRSGEREMALKLLAASHQLDGSTSPNPQAESLRKNLKNFLLDLTVEDGCMAPERVKEMQSYARAFDLEGQTRRLDPNFSQERVL